MPREPRSTDRIIDLLKSINGNAFDNDYLPKPGKFIEELCHEAAQHLSAYHQAHLEAIKHIEHESDLQWPRAAAIRDGIDHPDYDVARLPRSEDELGCDIHHNSGC